MRDYQSEKNFERERLAETLAVAGSQLEQSRKAAEEKKEGITEAKKDVFENSAHSFGNLYGSDAFEALVELSQLNNPVMESIAEYEDEVRKINRLESIMRDPYFARIDFRFEDEEEPEKIYIGRTSLSQKKSGDILIYDWRSPIASVFYRFMTGAAYYDAPNGQIDGNVTLKRQYEIRNGKLQYFFDADRNVSDEFLRQLLSKNTSPKMKAVVETIQKEQDTVIRDMSSSLLMVQGIAGSGKTSIALHRAAYLMYEGLQQSKLSADNILIISPNPVFEQYISDVLPELGEDNIHSIVFEELLKKLLWGRSIQSKNEFLEHAVTNGRYKRQVKSSMEFKTSKKFQKVLDGLLEDILTHWLKLEDIYHHGNCVVTAEELRTWLMRRPEVLLGARLSQLENFVLERAFGTVRKRGDGEERQKMKERVQQLCRINIFEIYSQLFDAENGFNFPENIVQYTRRNLQSGRIYYDDAIAMAYLHLKIYGTEKYRNIRQVVIDEAQDYYPLQYEIFRMLFPGAKFTVLGDIHQTIGKNETLSMYEQVQQILNKKNASLVTLTKSFRCTNEILKFSQQFLNRGLEVESFNRSGDAPCCVFTDSREELLENIVREVKRCQEKGLKTICLICKTGKNAAHLSKELESKLEVRLIKEQTAESLQGTFLMPVSLAKGLEFDAVIVCDADDGNYYEEDDKNLLYVECTRALHRLSLMCEGKKSRFIIEEEV